MHTAVDTGVRSYSLLRMDILGVLVPQEEVRTLEPATDLQTDAPPAGGVGWMPFNRERFPVFCFTEQLHRSLAVPSSRRICALLGAGEGGFGVLCSDVSLVRLPGTDARALPEAMTLPGRPIHGLALYQGAVLCLSSAARLFAHARAGAAAFERG